MLKAILSRKPPTAAVLVIIAFILFVPLCQWAFINVREWAIGDSPAARLDAPYFWAVVTLRIVGALFLAFLLWVSRTPAAIWVVITATWLAGPPLTFLLVGITLLSGSGGQYSVPNHWSYWSFLFPGFVALCLLGSRQVRQHYGVARANAKANTSGESS